MWSLLDGLPCTPRYTSIVQVRQTRYQMIADGLRSRVIGGDYAAGALLPSESDLSAEFSASRVTVRRALELLREDGLISSRQGFGWFVASDRVRQSLGHLGTIEAQLLAEGVESERRILDFRFAKAPIRVQGILGVDTVLRVRRMNLADGEPFALVTVWCPEALGAELSRADVERLPFYELVDVELGGATQTIGAGIASDGEADLLRVPSGAPVLRCERITRSVAGEAFLLSESVFPAHRTEFIVELDHAAASIAPTGLRLVD